MKTVMIDGARYFERPDSELPFGNVCRKCAFYKTPCYDNEDFNCHADSRSNGIGVFYVLAEKVKI